MTSTIRDPARKNESVIFTHGVGLCIQGFLYTFLMATILAASMAGVRVKFYFRGSNLLERVSGLTARCTFNNKSD